MRAVMNFGLWCVLAAGVLYLLLAPGKGLLFSGPWAVVGLGLLGAVLCRQSRRQLTQAAGDEARACRR